MNPQESKKLDCYSREPLTVQNGIPIFSHGDAYIENYEKIASDHVTQISSTQENPFMEEELWRSLEASTRDLITKHVPSGSRVLDVGVGLGRVLAPLNDYDRYGIDISLDYLSIAQQRGIKVAMAKIEDLPYKPEFFDAIVVCDVLEHVLDLSLCTEKILTCLRPGGTLIVRVPYKEDLNAYLNPDLPYDFVHLRAFDEASLWLHFHKIFGLRFTESATTTPYLQGSPRLKLRLLPEKVLKQLQAVVAEHPEMDEIINCLTLSEEQFQSWIYGIKEKSNALFKKISDAIIYGIEINAVFIKPFHDTQIIKSAKAPTSDHTDQDLDSLRYQLMALGRDFLLFREQTEKAEKSSQHALIEVESSLIKKINEFPLRLDSIDNEINKTRSELATQKNEIDSLRQFATRIQNEVAILNNKWYLRVIRKLKKFIDISR
jgi:SAM-dependent methyltransferase